jgi:hypothetical protein
MRRRAEKDQRGGESKGIIQRCRPNVELRDGSVIEEAYQRHLMPAKQSIFGLVTPR